MVKVVDGKKISREKEARLRQQVDEWRGENKIKPLLVSLVAKEDELGLLYTRLKQEAAERIGLEFKQIEFSFKEKDKAVSIVEAAAEEDNLKGLLIQKPVQSMTRQYFKNRDEFRDWWLKMTSQIPIEIDVDGLNPGTLGRMMVGRAKFYPATVRAVYEVLLMAYAVKELEGKRVVIVGSSEILGKPLAILLRDKGMTVVLCGSSCRNLGELTKKAEVVVACVGKQKLVRGEMISSGTVVIDAGMSQVKGKSVGDVDFDEVKKKARLITPVPGGIGPMTVANLLENVVEGLRKR